MDAGTAAEISEAARLTGWCLVAAGGMDLIVGLLVIRPRVSDPQQAVIVTTAMVGSGIGITVVGVLMLTGLIAI